MHTLFPGSVTGDLWHVAAAQILSTEYGDVDNLSFSQLVAVLVVTAEIQAREDIVPQYGRTVDEIIEKQKFDVEQEKSSGKKTYDYLHGIGVPTMLLQLKGNSPGKKDIEDIMHNQSNRWFDKKYMDFKNQSPDALFFDKLIKDGKQIIDTKGVEFLGGDGK